MESVQSTLILETCNDLAEVRFANKLYVDNKSVIFKNDDNTERFEFDNIINNSVDYYKTFSRECAENVVQNFQGKCVVCCNTQIENGWSSLFFDSVYSYGKSISTHFKSYFKVMQLVFRAYLEKGNKDGSVSIPTICVGIMEMCNNKFIDYFSQDERRLDEYKPPSLIKITNCDEVINNVKRIRAIVQKKINISSLCIFKLHITINNRVVCLSIIHLNMQNRLSKNAHPTGFVNNSLFSIWKLLKRDFQTREMDMHWLTDLDKNSKIFNAIQGVMLDSGREVSILVGTPFSLKSCDVLRVVWFFTCKSYTFFAHDIVKGIEKGSLQDYKGALLRRFKAKVVEMDQHMRRLVIQEMGDQHILTYKKLENSYKESLQSLLDGWPHDINEYKSALLSNQEQIFTLQKQNAELAVENAKVQNSRVDIVLNICCTFKRSLFYILYEIVRQLSEALYLHTVNYSLEMRIDGLEKLLEISEKTVNDCRSEIAAEKRSKCILANELLKQQNERDFLKSKLQEHETQNKLLTDKFERLRIEGQNKTDKYEEQLKLQTRELHVLTNHIHYLRNNRNENEESKPGIVMRYDYSRPSTSVEPPNLYLDSESEPVIPEQENEINNSSNLAPTTPKTQLKSGENQSSTPRLRKRNFCEDFHYYSNK